MGGEAGGGEGPGGETGGIGGVIGGGGIASSLMQTIYPSGTGPTMSFILHVFRLHLRCRSEHAERVSVQVSAMHRTRVGVAAAHGVFKTAIC